MRRIRVPLTTVLVLLLSAAWTGANAAPPAKPTKKDFQAAHALVMDKYPGPFKATYDLVVARIGKQHLGSEKENLYRWFSAEGGKCVVFFMTKDAQKGHAASGIHDGDANDCKHAPK